MIRVVLPGPLRGIAGVGEELRLEVPAPVTTAAILDAVELAHPVLRGTIRDQRTGARRPFLRFFACQRDLSHEPVEAPVPVEVAEGREPFLVVGAVAGG